MTSSGTGASGRRLGRYHLAEPVGGGPTGEVFRAKVYGVAGFERLFAVKRFHAEFVKAPDVAAAVASAARVYGGLEHPRIARLHEYGVAGGETFTATELVLGVDLGRLLAATFGVGEPLVAGAATALVSQAARAVGYAHGRNICHLGICPTNLIATPDGEVKVTDFGVLVPRLPVRPGNDESLAARIPYLAPEQLVGEPTSAATDVFQLGVVAYELLTGDRAFTGPSGFDVAQRILSAQPPAPPLPKPLVKVLARCMARSPFERYPDARAFADALDAAVRMTPLPGGARDIGGIVRGALQRIDELGETQASGALSFPLPAPPQGARGDAPARPGSPSPSLPIPAAGTPPGGRVPDGPKTRLGVGIPKIPDIPPRVPSPVDDPGDELDDAPTAIHERDGGFVRVSGASARKKASSAVKPPLTPPPVTPRPTPAAPPAERPPARPVHDTSSPAVPPGSMPIDLSTHQRDPIETIMEVSASQVVPLPDDEGSGPQPEPPEITMSTPDSAPEPPPPAPPGPPMMPATPPPPGPPAPLGGQAEPLIDRLDVGSDKGGRSPVLLLVALVFAAGLGVGAYYAWDHYASGDAAATTAAEAEAEDEGESEGEGEGEAEGEGEGEAEGEGEGAVAADDVADAGPPAPPIDAASTTLVIRSQPPGAKVYIDGTAYGKTPVETDAIDDTLGLALIRPGFKLHTSDISGGGVVDIALEEVTPPDGPAGIKVRCRHKNRYYVIVDGFDVGQLCPTERIGVDLGEHTVEIYDPVTQSRRSFRAVVEETRLSLRVRVD